MARDPAITELDRIREHQDFLPIPEPDMPDRHPIHVTGTFAEDQPTVDPADPGRFELFGFDAGQLALLGILGLAIWGALDG